MRQQSVSGLLGGGLKDAADCLLMAPAIHNVSAELCAQPLNTGGDHADKSEAKLVIEDLLSPTETLGETLCTLNCILTCKNEPNYHCMELVACLNCVLLLYVPPSSTTFLALRLTQYLILPTIRLCAADKINPMVYSTKLPWNRDLKDRFTGKRCNM